MQLPAQLATGAAVGRDPAAAWLPMTQEQGAPWFAGECVAAMISRYETKDNCLYIPSGFERAIRTNHGELEKPE